MVEFDRNCESLFDAARNATDPTPEDEARIRRAVAAKVGGGIIGLSTGTSAAAYGAAKGAVGAGAVTAKGLKVGLLWKIAQLSVAVAVGGGTALVIESRDRARQEPTASTTTAIATPTTKEVKTAPMEVDPSRMAQAPAAESIGGSSPEQTPIEPKGVSAPRRRSPTIEPAPARGMENNAPTPPATASPPANAVTPVAPPEVASSLRSEVALLSQMHQAWQAGDTSTLEREIAEHERRFPSGVLSEERDAMKVMLACRRADAEHAQRLGAEFAAQHAGSPHIGRVASVCADKRK